MRGGRTHDVRNMLMNFRDFYVRDDDLSELSRLVLLEKRVLVSI